MEKKSIFLTCSYILNISPWTNCTECIYINFHALRIEICLGCLIPWLQVMNRSLLQKRWVKALSASTDAEVSLQRIDCKWISQLLCPWLHFQIPFSLVNTCNSVWAYFYTKQFKKKNTAQALCRLEIMPGVLTLLFLLWLWLCPKAFECYGLLCHFSVPSVEKWNKSEKVSCVATDKSHILAVIC